MGLFDHHSHEPEVGEFMGLILGPDVLQTPEGAMPLVEITRAEFLRTVVSEGPGPEQTSMSAVAGGAVVGGVLFGAAGAVAGGLAGSTVKEEGPEALRTQAVKLIFETQDLKFSMDVPRDQEYAAVSFADAVKRAVSQHENDRR